MDRYDIRVNVWGDVSGPQYEWETVKAEDGDFVLYTDAQATVEALQATANYYKQPSKNGGVYSVSGGHIGNLMDWCKDNLKHCKFSGPDEDNLDLDLVQTAQQIPQLKTELSQLQALVRAAASAPGKDWLEWQLKLGEALDATTPAPRQRQVHSCEIPGCVSCANPEEGGDGE